jgi:hypothetical protein
VLVAKLTTSQLVTHEITERFVVTHGSGVAFGAGSRSCCVGFIPKATGGTSLDVGATTDKKTCWVDQVWKRERFPQLRMPAAHRIPGARSRVCEGATITLAVTGK